MSQVWAVLLAKGRMAGHQIASVRHQSKLKVAVLTVSAIGMWLGILFLFYIGFDWLISFGGQGGGEFVFGKSLLRQSLNIFSLSIFMLLVFSNTLVAFSTLFRSKEVVYLLQGPISYTDFYYARFIESVAFSSWSLAYLGSPMMLAYAWNTDAHPVFYPAMLFFFLPYVIVAAALGTAITMILVRIFPRMKLPALVALGGVSVGGFFFYIRSIIRGAQFSEETTITAILQAMNQTQASFLPSHWAAKGLQLAGDGALLDALFWFLLLLSTALMAVYLTGLLAGQIFYPGWSYLMGQDKQRIKPMDRGPMALLEPFLRPLREPYRSLFHKDIKLFWRDPTQWSQFVIFFGIMAIYIANIRNTTRLYETDFWRGWIACLNVGAVTLIVATLTSRFVFPLISLEGRRIWILGLAPLTFRQLIRQKFWLSVSLTSFFTVGLAVLSGHVLELEPIHYGLTVYSVLIANLGLSGLAVGLGALYPTFTEDNPARIVSGMGGTLNLLSSVAFVTCIVSIQVLALQWKALGLYTSESQFHLALAVSVIAITGLGGVCTWLPMRLGLRNLNNMEL
jgi:ABC-2 type transport system permease protein